MSIITSFWRAIVFWVKDCWARFRSSGRGFIQVLAVFFLVLVAFALPVLVVFTQNRQDTRSRAANEMRTIWGRVKTNDGRYWANSEAETLGHKENLDPQLAVHFYNEGDSGYDITDAEISRWLYSYKGRRRFSPPKGSPWEDDIVGWFFKADLKAHDSFFARVIPMDGYECDTWEYWIGDPDEFKLEDSGTGCRTSVFGMSYNGGRVYFTLKSAGSVSASNCSCDDLQDKAKARKGDFNCNDKVDFDDFSVWVFKRVTADDQNIDVDCNQGTSFLGEFNLWLTSYLH